MEKDNRIEIHNAQKQKRMKTQDDVIKLCIQKELDELGLDLSDEKYYQNEQFKNLEMEYILDGIRIPKAWWIEKNMIGQERLKGIYGIYAMGVEHEFAEEELKNSAWMDALVDKYIGAKIKAKEEFARTRKDIEQYFFRKKTENSSGSGLVERLKDMGFDVEKFDHPNVEVEKIKLLYFLYCFEADNKVKIHPFLGNPTLENVDNTFVGDETRNGELMACLKNNLLKEIAPNYIEALDKSLDSITTHWEKQIIYGRNIALGNKNIDELKDINEDLEWVLSIIKESGIQYVDSLLETFYLKLSLHEMTGRERDLLDVSDIYLEELPETEVHLIERYKELDKFELAINWDKGQEQYKAIFDYIKKHRKKIAQYVFGKDDVNSNDYKKLDRAIDGLKECLDFLWDNTKAKFIERTSVLFVVSCLQEIIFSDKKEKVENPFYRYEAKDMKTLNASLFNGPKALRKNQEAWVEKVMRRYNKNIGNGAVRQWERRMEQNLDYLLLEVYKSNSLLEMGYKAKLILFYMKIFIERRGIVWVRQITLQIILQSMNYCLVTDDARKLRLILGALEDSQFIDFTVQMLEDVAEAENTNEAITSLFKPEILADICDLKLQGYFELCIFPEERKVKVNEFSFYI